MNMYLSGFSLPPGKWPCLSSYLEHHFQRESFFSCFNDVELELEKVKQKRTEFA
ncbi:MAG: hypothetical protein ACRCXC_04315 [Legionella sp.]